MENAYTSEASSAAYTNYLASPYGREFKQILGQAFLNELNPQKEQPLNLLDAGCGDGWLAGLIKSELPSWQVQACDLGQPLISSAQKQFPKVEFKLADLTKPLPYPKETFDFITSSMVLHDTENETAVLQNFQNILKPDGVALVTIVNPYYGFPVGEWKRGLLGRILNQLPRLRLARPYNQLLKWKKVSFSWRNGLNSYFTPFSRHIQSITASGLYLDQLVELKNETVERQYNLSYQLHHFPIILLLRLKKLRQ